MSDDNVVDLAAHRQGAVAEHLGVPSGARNADRSKEAMEILKHLRGKARIPKDDRPIVARNLGRLLIEIEPESPKLLAKKILLSSCQKRKRYIRLPDDPVGASVSYAASGLEFAGIIERLVDERIKRGFERTQALVTTVYDVLRDTSFRRPSRFQIREGTNEDDAEFLIRAIKQVFDKLAQEVELAEHFERVSRHSIYPNCPYHVSSRLLVLDEKYGGNDIYRWDWMTDEDEDDLQTHIPWWAPRLVIGYLYIPFQSDCLYLPQQGITKLKQACRGEITQANWSNDYSEVFQPFLTPEYIHTRRVYYRSPVLLIGLPRPNGIVPCLYAATSNPTGFQENEHAWCSEDDPGMPAIATNIGDSIDNDRTFFYEFCPYPGPPFLVCAVESDILVMSCDIDGNLTNDFTPNFWIGSSIHDLPDWLQSHPVGRFLKLTPDSDLATHFALSQRNFPQRLEWFRDSETFFRPSFADSSSLTRLRSNTIGAYLLRNFADAAGIFEGLKTDAMRKITATKTVIDAELKKTQNAFDRLYSNDGSQDDVP